MKIKNYVSGGMTRCGQACFRMIVDTLANQTISESEADKITGYVEGRGTWQFKMLLGFASFGLSVKDHENFNVALFLENPVKAIEEQTEDKDAIKGILDETDCEAEQKAVASCLQSPLIKFVDSIPKLDDLKNELSSNAFVIVNVNSKVLQNKPGREGHILIIEDILDDHIIVTDPGPQGGLGVKIPIDLFIKAWNSPSQKMANFISVKKI